MKVHPSHIVRKKEEEKEREDLLDSNNNNNLLGRRRSIEQQGRNSNSRMMHAQEKNMVLERVKTFPNHPPGSHTQKEEEETTGVEGRKARPEKNTEELQDTKEKKGKKRTKPPTSSKNIPPL